MRKWGKIGVGLALAFTMLQTPTYAGEMPYYGISTVNEESVILPEGVKASYDISDKAPKGQIASSATLRITNAGSGKIGVYAETLTHVAVDRISMRIYLDRLNETTGKWENVTYYDFEAKASDHPDQELHSAVVSFDISGKKRGCYYRLRGVHGVYKGAITEGYSTKTEAIHIN